MKIQFNIDYIFNECNIRFNALAKIALAQFKYIALNRFKFFKKTLKCSHPKFYNIFFNAHKTTKPSTRSNLPASQKDMIAILKVIKALKERNQPINLSKLLKSKGLSLDIHDIDFAITNLSVKPPCPGTGKTPIWGEDLFNGVDFSGVNFTNCHFDNCNFSSAKFKNNHFLNCTLSNTLFEKSTLQNIHFDNCEMQNSSFGLAELENVLFNEVKMAYACLHKAKFNYVSFANLDLSGVSFFNSEVKNSKIVTCQTENALFFDTEKQFEFLDSKKPTVNKPIILLLWSFETAGIAGSKIHNSIIAANAIPLKYDYRLEGEINTEQLDRESEEKLRSYDPTSGMSIAQHLIAFDENSPNVNHVKKTVLKLTTYLDGVCLPGGADLKPELYGQTVGIQTKPEASFKRAVLESTLIDVSNTKGLPLIGICRGLQIGNVFYGGDLTQYVKGHEYKIQDYRAKKIAGIIRGIMNDNTLTSVSAHHQALSKIGSGLEEIVTYKNIPKALETSSGAPRLFLQFHPEFKNDKTSITGHLINIILSAKNQNFWHVFVDSAKSYRNKRQLIKNLPPLKSHRFVDVFGADDGSSLAIPRLGTFINDLCSNTNAAG